MADTNRIEPGLYDGGMSDLGSSKSEDPTGQLTVTNEIRQINKATESNQRHWLRSALRRLFGFNRTENIDSLDTDAESPESGTNPRNVIEVTREKVVSLVEFKEAKNQQKKVVFGEKLLEPEQVIRCIDEAISVLKARFGDAGLNEIFDISYDSIGEILKFSFLPGLNVGQATKNGIHLDPALLLHPKVMIAYVLASEFAHNETVMNGKRILGSGKTVYSEEMIEGMLSEIFPNEQQFSVYKPQRGPVDQFIKLFNPNNSFGENAIELFYLFVNGLTDKILDQAIENNPAHASELYRLFFQVIPRQDGLTKEPGTMHMMFSDELAANDNKEISSTNVETLGPNVVDIQNSTGSRAQDAVNSGGQNESGASLAA